MPKKDPCSELAKTITELAMAHGEHPDVKNLDDVVKRMQRDIPEITRTEVVASINEATTGHREAATELQKKLADLRREARNDKAVREAVDDFRKHVAENTQPAKAQRKPAPEAIRKVRQELAGLRKQVADASPQRREVVQRRIDQIEKAIAKGEQLPKRERPAAPADLQALRERRDGLMQQMRAAAPEKRQAIRDQIKALNDHLAAGTVPATEAKPTPPADIAALRQKRDELRARVMQADPALRVELRQKIREATAAIEAGKYPDKPAAPARQAPPDLAALRAELAAKRTELERLNPKRLDEARARIAELEGHLKAGTLPTPKDTTAPADPPELVALRDSADRLRQALAKSEPAIRQRFEGQIADLTARLEDGVSLPNVKETPKLSPELERLRFERDKLRRQVRDRIEAQKPTTFWGYTPPRRVGQAVKGAAETLNVARSILTSLDFSAVLRQGGFVALGNPDRAARALGPMFRAFASEQGAYRVAKEIDARPNRPLYERAGLHLSDDPSAPLARQEEAFMSRFVGKIPGVAGSERAYRTFLNKLRADSFDAMMETLARNGQATDAEAKAIANYINVATGRGSLAGMENSAQALATIFFAPRYVTSRFQLLAGQPLIGGSARTRTMIAGEYGKFLAGAGVVLGLGALAGGKIGANPNDPDFGKIRFGNTTLDPLSGLAQAARVSYRLGTPLVRGVVSDLLGEERPKASGDDAFTIGVWFLRTKLAPLPGAAVDLATGKNVVGEKATLASTAQRLVMPLSIKDVYDAMSEQGIARGTALSLLGLFGMSIQKAPPPKAPPEHKAKPKH